MRLTLDIDPTDPSEREIARSLLNALSEPSERKPEPEDTTDTAEEIVDTVDETVDDETAYDPEARIYGEKGEKSRRTKEEKARDDDIAARWAALWPSKKVPEKPVGELEAHLDKIEAESEEETFDVGADDDDDEVLDLEEFRAIIVKHSKKLGGKKLGEIMAPHKNPGTVPESERRDYADKIIEAAENAS